MTISTTTGGATIRYTTNGTTPSSTVGTVYSSPVNISSNTTLQAIAYESGYTNSTVASGVYTLNVPATYTTDTSTEGAWWSSGGGYIYGGMGYVLCAWNNGTDVVSLSGSYVSSVTPSTVATATGRQHHDRTRRPSTRRLIPAAAACWYYDPDFSVQIALDNPDDGVAHRMAVYCLDWDNEDESSTIDLENPSTGTSLLSRRPGHGVEFSNGMGGLHLLRQCAAASITDETGYGNAVISVIAFDNGSAPACAAPTFTPAAGAYGPAQSVTISTTTGGATINYTPMAPRRVRRSARSTAARSASPPPPRCKPSPMRPGYANSTVTSGSYTINGACATPTFSPTAGTFTTSTSVTISTSTGGATHQLYHQWHHAEFDRRHGVQQPGEHHRHLHAAGHRL